MIPEDAKIIEQLAQELANEIGVPMSAITVHVCGRVNCEHKWEGPMVQVGNGCFSVTCSKCGIDSFSDSYWRLP